MGEAGWPAGLCTYIPTHIVVLPSSTGGQCAEVSCLMHYMCRIYTCSVYCTLLVPGLVERYCRRQLLILGPDVPARIITVDMGDKSCRLPFEVPRKNSVISLEMAK